MNAFRTVLGVPGKERISRIHFVGIGGSGMNGIAEVLLNEGYQVSGSDMKENAALGRLSAQGAIIHIGHAPDNVRGADVVVKSTAVSDDNIEIQTARSARIPVVRRAEMLTELMRSRYGIAIAGTHGKTTTTSLVASILAQGGLDPTFVIGGQLNSCGSHARLGTSRYLVTEADESDASFLHLLPMLAVITNIDADHLETYGGELAALDRAFIEFLHNLPFYGLAVLCIDDPGVQRILPAVSRSIVTYGLSPSADVCATKIQVCGVKTKIRVSHKASKAVFDVVLNLPGEHNVANALAAISVGLELGIAHEDIVLALENFSGVGRRFQVLGEYDFGKGNALLVDDYGHHPRELLATIQAARASFPDKRLVLAFQPHRYTRTRDLFDDFVEVLAGVDQLLLLTIFSAGETPIEHISSEQLMQAIVLKHQIEAQCVSDQQALFELLPGILKQGDLLLLSGAGDIGACSAALAEKIAGVHEVV
jgi:UDP-N-acetylmuramate--alanine ligase